MAKKDRRKNNPSLDAHALARGLKRRQADKLNERFYLFLVATIGFILAFFTIGAIFKG